MGDLREGFERYARASAEALARDLTSLLNRAQDLGIAVCVDVDYEEGTSYSIEWVFGDPHYLSVEYDHSAKVWMLNRDDDD